MVNDQLHQFVLEYGKTSSENLPEMPSGKYFCIGYNPRYGLVDVMEEDGEPFFEGRVNIERLLASIGNKEREIIDAKVEDYIMQAYANFLSSNRRELCSTAPQLEILTYKG